MERINKTYILFLLILITSCERNDNDKQKEVNIGNVLSIKIPQAYTFNEKKGIDSYVFELSNEKGVLFKGDLGDYSNNLVEPNYPVFSTLIKDSILKRTNNQLGADMLYFSDYPDIDYELRIFSKQYYLYDTINGIAVKSVYPKKKGKGIMGIYIPKLKNGKSFSLYAEDLESADYDTAESIFQSLRYK